MSNKQIMACLISLATTSFILMWWLLTVSEDTRETKRELRQAKEMLTRQANLLSEHQSKIRDLTDIVTSHQRANETQAKLDESFLMFMKSQTKINGR